MFKTIIDSASNAVSSALGSITPYLLIAALALGGAGTGYVVRKIDNAEIAGLKASLAGKEKDISACKEANKMSADTIASLKKEMDASASLCEKRLKTRTRACAIFKQIDNANKGGKNEAPFHTGDALGDMLNSMLSGSAIGQN